MKDLKAPIYERLISAGSKYKSKHVQQAVEKDGTTTDGCTFQPQTLKYKSGQKSQQPAKADKWSELFQMAEKKKERKNRDVDDIEIERGEQEFTFKPKISRKSLRMEMNAGSPRRKQQMKAPTDTGLKRRGHQVATEEFVFDIQTKQEGEPLLHVDVNLPQKNVRVALYKNSDIDQVAHNFVQKYELDNNMEETLRQTLHQHMANALQES